MGESTSGLGAMTGKITLIIGKETFTSTTNSKGFALFKDIPCDSQVKILIESDGRFNRYLKCGTKTVEWEYVSPIAFSEDTPPWEQRK